MEHPPHAEDEKALGAATLEHPGDKPGDPRGSASGSCVPGERRASHASIEANELACELLHGSRELAANEEAGVNVPTKRLGSFMARLVANDEICVGEYQHQWQSGGDQVVERHIPLVCVKQREVRSRTAQALTHARRPAARSGESHLPLQYQALKLIEANEEASMLTEELQEKPALE